MYTLSFKLAQHVKGDGGVGFDSTVSCPVDSDSLTLPCEQQRQFDTALPSGKR